MKKRVFVLLFISMLFLLSACSLGAAGNPTPFPTLPVMPSPTLLPISPTPSTPAPVLPTVTLALPSPTPGGAVPTAAAVPSATPGSGIVVGNPSGPYGVILVAPGDVLNIHSAPGTGAAVSGSFAATATNVMRTGRSTTVAGDLWVEVQNPGGGNGWVNAHFLSEYVLPATFCTDTRVNTLITNLDHAFTANDGVQLATLVSPAHGVTVYLWRYGNAVTFKPSDARWVFDSTYEHDWGAAPGSGLDTKGSFHVAVLPNLQDVFNATYTLTCNSLGSATQYGNQPWPAEYTNINYYTVYKPGTPGVDLNWRYWLVGVEYVQGQPYVFALIHFAWEP